VTRLTVFLGCQTIGIFLIQEAIKQRQKDLEEKKAKAKNKGLSEEEFNENKLLEMARLTIKEIGSFATLLGLKAKTISSPSDWKNTLLFISEIKSECDRLWAESPEIKEQEEKQAKRSRLDSFKRDYESHLQELKHKEKEVQDFERKNGSKDEIEEKIRKLIKEIKNVDKEIEQESTLK